MWNTTNEGEALAMLVEAHDAGLTDTDIANDCNDLMASVLAIKPVAKAGVAPPSGGYGAIGVVNVQLVGEKSRAGVVVRDMFLDHHINGHGLACVSFEKDSYYWVISEAQWLRAIGGGSVTVWGRCGDPSSAA